MDATVPSGAALLLGSLHAAGVVAGIVAFCLCLWGVIIDPRVRYRWPFLVPSILLGAAAFWLLTL